MNKRLAILGSGHLGRQIAHFALSDNHYSEVLFFDDFAENDTVNGHKMLGGSDQLESKFNENAFDELIIGIGYRHFDARKRFFEQFDSKVPFGRIIHSSSWIDPSAKIGKGTIIYPGCCIDAHVEVGDNVIVNIACAIAHDTKIGNHSFLSPRTATAGFVSIGESCFTGINTTIIDNISVISGTRTGGGTVIIKDITDSGLYVSNPAKKIKP